MIKISSTEEKYTPIVEETDKVITAFNKALIEQTQELGEGFDPLISSLAHGIMMESELKAHMRMSVPDQVEEIMNSVNQLADELGEFVFKSPYADGIAVLALAKLFVGYTSTILANEIDREEEEAQE